MLLVGLWCVVAVVVMAGRPVQSVTPGGMAFKASGACLVKSHYLRLSEHVTLNLDQQHAMIQELETCMARTHQAMLTPVPRDAWK